MNHQAQTWRRWLLVTSVFVATLLSNALSTFAQDSHNSFAPVNREKDDGRVTLTTEVISVSVTVTDKLGKIVPGLPKESFAIYEDKVAQEVSFFSAQDAPASVGIVFDVSGSMAGEKIENAREALVRFVQTSHTEDDYSLIGFNDRAEVLLENTADSNTLLNRIAGINPRGDTALYDAVAMGLAQVRQGRWSKRALIVITDGEDNNSRISFKKLRQMLKESDVMLYGILIRDFSPRSIGEIVLDELTEMSGGRYFAPRNAEEMSEAFEKIALELRQQYSLGYTPTNFQADGQWRKLTVKVTPPPDHPRLIVRARTGYYALSRRQKK